jgi:hypothetical protein
MLGLGELRPAHRLLDVRVGDRLALDAGGLALNGNGPGLPLGGDVLAQAGAADLAPLAAGAQLLLRARHRIVGGLAVGVAPGGLATAALGLAGGPAPCLGIASAGLGAALRSGALTPRTGGPVLRFVHWP